MKHILSRILLFIALLLTGAAAHAQTPVYQSGIITPGDCVVWTSQRFIGDCTQNGGLAGLTITSTTPTFNIFDGPQTGAFHELSLGANSSSNAGTLNYGAFNGASSLPFLISINGGTISINSSALTLGAPGTVNGSLVVASNSSSNSATYAATSLSLAGASSGNAIIGTVGAAGTPTILLPTTSGTAGQPWLSGGGTGASTWGTVTGNTTLFVTQSGTSTNGHCPVYDASGNIRDSGSTCASSGVGAGTAGNLPWYATTGSAVSANTNLNISAAALTIGVAGSSQGSISLTGAGSGTVTIGVASAAGTYSLTLPNAAPVQGQVLEQGASALTWAFPGVVCCTYENANFNAAALTGYCVDTSSGTVTATAEASPASGDAYQFIDCFQSFATNNFTVARNGNPIMNLAQNFIVNVNNFNFFLQWDTHYSDWVIR